MALGAACENRKKFGFETELNLVPKCFTFNTFFLSFHGLKISKWPFSNTFVEQSVTLAGS